MCGDKPVVFEGYLSLWSGVGKQLFVSFLTSTCCGQWLVVVHEHVL